MKKIVLNNGFEKKKIEEMLCRSSASFKEVDEIVEDIIEKVKAKGDRGVAIFTEAFDGVKLENSKVSDEEINEAMTLVSEELKDTLRKSADRINQYHVLQKQNSFFDNNITGMVGQIIRPLERVGIYVPGGKSPYPSTVFMNAIPAKIAGVKEIVMTTPAGKDGKVNPVILVAAQICGVKEIYKIGGAQAVAALAYGTETIEKVDKIVGPGNIFVARAKKQVYGQVAIDMIAGPSEICIIADENKNPRYIAADLLSQAEHDTMAQSILITTSETLAEEVERELALQIPLLNKKEIINESLENQGYIFICKSIEDCLKLSNIIAPEHLEVMLDDPFSYVSKITNAGAIFLGEYSPEALGDYMAGPNHTLPTSGTARFSSPLGVYDFIKKSSLIYFDREQLKDLESDIQSFAACEDLMAHKNSIGVRFENDENNK